MEESFALLRCSIHVHRARLQTKHNEHEICKSGEIAQRIAKSLRYEIVGLDHACGSVDALLQYAEVPKVRQDLYNLAVGQSLLDLLSQTIITQHQSGVSAILNCISALIKPVDDTSMSGEFCFEFYEGGLYTSLYAALTHHKHVSHIIRQVCSIIMHMEDVMQRSSSEVSDADSKLLEKLLVVLMDQHHAVGITIYLSRAILAMQGVHSLHRDFFRSAFLSAVKDASDGSYSAHASWTLLVLTLVSSNDTTLHLVAIIQCIAQNITHVHLACLGIMIVTELLRADEGARYALWNHHVPTVVLRILGRYHRSQLMTYMCSECLFYLTRGRDMLDMEVFIHHGVVNCGRVAFLSSKGVETTTTCTTWRQLVRQAKSNYTWSRRKDFFLALAYCGYLFSPTSLPSTKLLFGCLTPQEAVFSSTKCCKKILSFL